LRTDTRRVRKIVEHFLAGQVTFPSQPQPIKSPLLKAPLGEFGRAIYEMELVEEKTRALMHKAQRDYLFER